MLDPRPKKRIRAEEASHKLFDSASDNLGAVAIRSTSLASPASHSFFRSPVNSRGFSHYYDSTASQAPVASRYRNDFEEVEWLVSSRHHGVCFPAYRLCAGLVG
jgi:hypothetical protein